MKRKRKSAEEGCEKCEHRRGSLSEMPGQKGEEVLDSEAKKREEDIYREVLRELGMSRARRMRRDGRGKMMRDGRKRRKN